MCVLCITYQARCWLTEVVSNRVSHTPQTGEGAGLLTYLYDSINKLLGAGGEGGNGHSEPCHIAAVLLLAVDAEYSEGVR